MYSVNYKFENGSNSGIMRPMEDVGAPKWDLTLTLLLSWIIIYLCVLKGNTRQLPLSVVTSTNNLRRSSDC